MVPDFFVPRALCTQVTDEDVVGLEMQTKGNGKSQ